MDTIKLSLAPEQILNDPLLNKGSAFTEEERDSLGLHGYLPCHISTIEEQVRRRYHNFCDQNTHLAKYSFLSSLQNRNEILFYRLVLEHLSEMMPYIYTPTVGDVSLQYSSLFTEHRGVYLSYPLKDKMEAIIDLIPKDGVDVIVVTDGERILGLGDLGVGGMAIPVGKLSLYTLFGGIHPARALPIMLDVGTNNQELLKDPLYLGWRHERVTGKEYDHFVDRFITVIKKRYPKVLLQWEDFAKPHAEPLLSRYKDKICSFNDDIQGTAAVVLAAILSAVKSLKSTLTKQRIAVLGGGSAGIGICNEILRAMVLEGISEKEGAKLFYVVDIQGLIHDKMAATESQLKFAQKYEDVSRWKVANPSHITLLDVVQNVHPTILIGVSTQGGAFTKEIVQTMAKNTPRPAIFPLSNPTTKSEAHPSDLLEWTNGQAIIATGSPFPPVSYKGKTFSIAQCNNVYIFPGVGLGVIASMATKVTEQMFVKAAQILSEHSPLLKNSEGLLFPPLEELRSISRQIAIAVAEVAQKENVAPKCSHEEIIHKVDKAMWYPNYPLYKRP